MRLRANDPDIETLIARIDRNDLDLQPDFQRGEVWTTAKKRRLIDSILRSWHVPPIHIVVRADGLQEVLDGQQRLAAIRDFVHNHFTVDGSIEPYDELIMDLGGKRYRDLPPEIRRHFLSFTIRTFLLTDYNPEEPGELFFRLNQISSLTSAEQRNAFYGASRDQVRNVVEFLSLQIGEERIGFNNKRMAYDDVVSKFLFHCEKRKIAIKTNATDLSQRFKDRIGFEDQFINEAKDAISIIFLKYNAEKSKYSLNKAVLLSFMLFTLRAIRCKIDKEYISDFIDRFANIAAYTRKDGIENSNSEQIILRLAMIFVDRASFRVSDVSSVIARDFALWSAFILNYPLNRIHIPNFEDSTQVNYVLEALGKDTHSDAPLNKFETHISALSGWGRLDA